MTSHRFLQALGGILVSLMLLAPSAGAESRQYAAKPGYVTKVRLQGSNGYRVNVSAGHHGGVTVTVRKGGLKSEYSVRGAETGRYGADARLGGLGRVRFRFVPSGRERRVAPPPWCEGPHGRLIEGVVQGRIRFTGEDGYTRLAVRRAEAEIEAWPKMRCRYLEGEEGGSKEWSATFHASDGAGPSIRFAMGRYARHLRSRSKQVAFQADAAFFRHPVRIFHSVTVAADASTFSLLGPKTAPENFKVAPPPPFSGTATFQRTPESIFSWEGDLSIQFPGTAPIALAGPGFHTNYCALRGCISQGPLLPDFG
ncbi:MAG TPA: hypothetical protein VF255_07815 [Solirubrobacterales bacterium]